MTRRIIPYNPALTAYARQLRRNMTLAEILLWRRLRRRQLCGYAFGRQRPIGEYIVDFYCKDLRLAIEVDGCSHNLRKREDRARQRRLERLGVRFLRFWDQEVKSDMASVLRRIEEWIRCEEGNPPPAPPEEGSDGTLPGPAAAS